MILEFCDLFFVVVFGKSMLSRTMHDEEVRVTHEPDGVRSSDFTLQALLLLWTTPDVFRLIGEIL